MLRKAHNYECSEEGYRGPYERATSYVILTEIAQRRCGQAAADVLTAPFALGDKNLLSDLLNTAGIHDAVVTLREGTMTYPTIEVFVETEVKGSPLEALLESVRALSFLV